MQLPTSLGVSEALYLLEMLCSELEGMWRGASANSQLVCNPLNMEDNILVTSAISVALAGFYSCTTACFHFVKQNKKKTKQLGFHKILMGRSMSVTTAGTDLGGERSESGPDFQNGLRFKQSFFFFFFFAEKKICMSKKKKK